MKAILKKDKCLTAIGERPAEVTNDNKWDEMDRIVIANLHLTLADGVLSSIEEKKNAKEIWDHLAPLKKNFKCYKCGKLGHFKKDFRGLNTSYPQGNVASTLEDGNALCCEAVSNESRKRFADIIGIRSIMVKMHDGTVRTIRDVRHVEGLKKNLLSLGQLVDLCCKEAKASVSSHIPSHRIALTWHQKLGHISEQGMKILVERKLLPGLTKVEIGSRKKIKCLRMNNGVELKTPMEMWTGKSVNFSDLNIFGSPVYVMYNSQETTKLDPKSRKCLFLGYADREKGYRLWYPTAHKVVVSIDVVFMEEKIQENEEGDSTTRETTSMQMEKEFQSNDSFEVAPLHE
ncbi:gag-pol polyprotein [Tanacetum coccineum]|uniref:Gag-pol polyprotein n=1 Tax=Tanacetum coccineum TaxID=301880 RepID=A0ABQ5FZP9_9ASTR